jgi:hypothetical protein
MRSSARRSGQVASERSKVSEHPLIGPPPGPPGPPVIQGLSTVEVRWILPGQLDAAVAGWFDMGHCQSYAEWLSRHRVTAAIHPREGEESPARRRQDQSSSHYQRREGRTEMTRGREHHG